MTLCALCSEDNTDAEHYNSEKHIKNKLLLEYASNKKRLAENRNGIVIYCHARTVNGSTTICADDRIKIIAKPNEDVLIQFLLSNNNKNEDIEVIHVIMHSKLNFVFSMNGLKLGCKPSLIKSRKKCNKKIVVKFNSSDIGQYETPIFFRFNNLRTNESIIVVRDMVVYVQEGETVNETVASPYDLKPVIACQVYKTTMATPSCSNCFPIPKNYKNLFAKGLNLKDNATEGDQALVDTLRDTFDTGVTKDNYVRFFHCLLWYDETAARINLKNYNMTGVHLIKRRRTYSLHIPGLAEKRPSLLVGDIIFLKPQTENIMYEGVVEAMEENEAYLKGLDPKFIRSYTPENKYDVKFYLTRVSLERMHDAVHNVWKAKQESRIFPQKNPNVVNPQPLLDFYNPHVGDNPEQRTVVQNIVSGTAGTAPYLLHGPPGTGKTVTVVEAVLQLIAKDPENRIMICTDSNMAADNVAAMLITYAHMFPKNNFLLRANSKFRPWETLPQCLAEYSNGTSAENFYYVDISMFVEYSIVVTTLSHSAVFGKELKRKYVKRYITHLFIDEAGQASESLSLVPVCGLLATDGMLVLAGDPLQLGPVICSRGAKAIGLGMSLMERLKITCPLYSDETNDPHYMVMLRNNFRSDPDILELPNKLFYKDQLKACAPIDPFSRTDIMGERENSRAVVFHGVLSNEHKVGKSPSFFNTMEVEIVRNYVTCLITKHNIQQSDIGIVTPYIRQVYHVKKSLKLKGFDDIEVGSVEAFQGKEKRFIIISTVRANSNLLAHAAKFRLGFLVEDKRFNVALTRAKAKLIIIGNPMCLQKDTKWKKLMQMCREFGTYFGVDWENGNKVSEDFVNNMIPLFQDLKIKE